MDSLDDQKAFASKHSIRFPLIADEDGSIAKAYDVLRDGGPLAGRHTVVIGPDGAVVKAYADVQAK